MTKKQIEFLNEYNRSMLTPGQDKFFTGKKYKNGKHMLGVSDLSSDQWTDLVLLGDIPNLWNQADHYLNNL